MNRSLTLVVAALLLGAAALPAQSDGGRTLPAFRSDRALTSFLRDIPRDPPQRPATSAPCPDAPLPPVPPPPPDSVPAGRTLVIGRVTDGCGAPAVGALVWIGSLDVGAATGADGRYRLVIPSGYLLGKTTLQVTASRTGLVTATRELVLSPGDAVVQSFQLTPAMILLEEMVVTGTAGAVESITSTQHEGVDEGGIVKVHGDHLVVLRRGRLFTVDVGDGALRPVDAVDAFGPREEGIGSWYDELLVSDGHVVVIGYSYARGGTEIVRFRLDGDGRLHYRGTWILRSYDYYSSRNYASRLVDGTLVLYAPVPAALDRRAPDGWLPAAGRWKGRESVFRRILAPGRIYHPGRRLYERDGPTVHTVVRCDLRRDELDCSATGVVGPHARVFYVSPSAVYVWTADWHLPARGGRASATVYRIPLDGTAPAALGVEGSPIDQFSFLESGDGMLNVLVQDAGRGDGMWRAERPRGDGMRLLRVPLARFGDGRGSAARADYRMLPAPDGVRHNRFVGRHLLYGTGSGWGPAHDGAATLFATRWAGGEVSALALPHDVDRIEVMGRDAVVVGTDDDALHFTGIRLDREPALAQRYVLPVAAQGEQRSHGFFYRTDGEDQGVIGLPVRRWGEPGAAHLFDGSASIVYLENRDGRFDPLGMLYARPVEEEDDDCIASCVDWYGNARPIFLRGRVFALLGYEIVEGTMEGGALRELRRVEFTPRAAVARH